MDYQNFSKLIREALQPVIEVMKANGLEGEVTVKADGKEVTFFEPPAEGFLKPD